MQCPSCGKTDRVTIGNRQYCASCGTVVSSDAGATSATPGTRPVAMMDIRPPSGASEPVVAAEPVLAETATQPQPEPEPVAAESPSSEPTTVAPVAINPSNSFHKPPVSSDRAIQPTQKAQVPVDAVIKPAVAVPTITTPEVNETPAIKLDATKQSARLAKASGVPKSSAINKFTQTAPAVTPPEEPKPQTSSTAGQAAPMDEPSLPPLLAPATTTSLVSPAEPVVAAPNNPPVLPNAAVTQVDNLQKLVPPAEPSVGLASTLKPSNVAIAAVALAVMAGWVWAANYPAMTLKLASAKAGIEASLPGYVPPSFALAGPVSYSPGQVTVHFHSANGDALTLSQAKTSWDPRSLLENFVTQKTDKYLAVQDHGLTVYVYNGNQASWINKGIWYTIEGNNQLNREQILKIVDSL